MENLLNVRSQISLESLTEKAKKKKKKSSGIFKNSSDLQQGNVKLLWSISWRSGAKIFYCSIYIWCNKKALLPLTNKLKDKAKFM